MARNMVSQKYLIPFFVLLWSCAFCCINIKHGKIYDDQHRELYFHGMNIAVKVPPYLPKTDAYDEHMSFVKEDIDKLKADGFNAIRLGIMWPGVQPKKDEFNETYLHLMSEIVKNAGEAGIYTIVEFHQKVLSEAFCGIGLPAWLIQQDHRYKTFPFPIEREKYPLTDAMVPDKIHCKRHNTSTYFYSYDAAQGFSQLYDTKSFLYQRFAKFWLKVVQYFKDSPYVIAYDLINEPWVGNQIRNPFLLIPGMAEKCKLQRFYDRLSQRIRAVDQKTPICFQPTLIDEHAGTGYYHPPGGNNYKDKSILCFSYGQQNEKSMWMKYYDAKRLGVPSLVSQFYGGDHALKMTQGYYQSWFYWYYKDFGSCHKSGEERYHESEKLQLLGQKKDRKDICKKLIRPYLQRVAGCIEYSDFCPDSKRFIASYDAVPDGETILYLNKQVTYENKYSIQVSPKDKVDVIQSQEQGSKNYVVLKFKGKERQVVVVNVVKVENK